MASINYWRKFRSGGGFRRARNLNSFIELVLDSGLAGEGASAILVAIVLFAIMHLVWRERLKTGAPNGGPLRAAWMWDNDKGPEQALVSASSFTSMKVVANPQPYLKWAKDNGIYETWMDVSSLHDQIDKLNAFLKAGAAQGMSTQFLFDVDNPNELQSSGKTYSQKFTALLKFISKLDQDFWPSGVQTDIEPTALTNGPGDATNAYNAHKTYLLYMDLFNMIHDSQLSLSASVMYWWLKFEAETVSPKANGMDYGEALLELGIDVTVQDYRAPGKNEIAPARRWSEVADDHGRLAHIGVLIGPPIASTEYCDRMEDLEPHLKSIADSCGADSPGDPGYTAGHDGAMGFGGVAVHDTYHYQKAQQNLKEKC